MNFFRQCTSVLFAVMVMTSCCAQSHSFVDKKTQRTLTITKIDSLKLTPQDWDNAYNFTIRFHGRDPQELSDKNQAVQESFAMAQERFKNQPEDCLFSYIKDGDALIGIAIVEFMESNIVTSCYTLGDFKTYDPKTLMENLLVYLRFIFPFAQAFSTSAQKHHAEHKALLKALGFKEVGDEMQHPIRQHRAQDSQQFIIYF